MEPILYGLLIYGMLLIPAFWLKKDQEATAPHILMWLIVAGVLIRFGLWWVVAIPVGLFTVIMLPLGLLALKEHGYFGRIGKLFLWITGIRYVWDACAGRAKNIGARRTCVVCQNWTPSMLMLDGLTDLSHRPLPMCRKHAASRDRIWALELALGFDQTGKHALIPLPTRSKRKG